MYVSTKIVTLFSDFNIKGKKVKLIKAVKYICNLYDGLLLLQSVVWLQSFLLVFLPARCHLWMQVKQTLQKLIRCFKVLTVEVRNTGCIQVISCIICSPTVCRAFCGEGRIFGRRLCIFLLTAKS